MSQHWMCVCAVCQHQGYGSGKIFRSADWSHGVSYHHTGLSLCRVSSNDNGAIAFMVEVEVPANYGIASVVCNGSVTSFKKLGE